MPFLLVVLAGSLFLLPVAILLFAFVAALADYVLGGGPAATSTGSNADPSPQTGGVAQMSGLLESE